MLHSWKITRTLQIVYGLVLCALIVSFFFMSHSDELQHSMKDLALRGRTSSHSFEAPPESFGLSDVVGDKDEAAAKIPIVELGEVSTPTKSSNQEFHKDNTTTISHSNDYIVPTEEGNKRNNVPDEEPVVVPSMPMPPAMLQQLKNIYVDAHAKYSKSVEDNHLTSAPTLSPTSVAIVKELPLILSVPLSSHLQTDPEAMSSSLESLYHGHWSIAALKISEHEKFSTESPSVRTVGMLNDFHSALKYGQICSDGALKDLRQQKTATSKYQYRTSNSDLTAVNDLAAMRRAAVREVMGAKAALFIEHSRATAEEVASAAAAFTVSASHPLTSSILFDSSPTSVSGLDSQHKTMCAMDKYPDIRRPPSNVFLVKPLSPDAISTTRWNHAFECVQLVSSFEAIFNQDADPLPFDMEDALGWALCRCNVTIVPSQLPSTAFFSYWENVEMLLSEAILATNGACSVTVNTSSVHAFPSSASSSSHKYSSSSRASSSSASSHHLFVYRDDHSVTLSPLPASTVMTSDLAPSSRAHMLAYLSLMHGQAHSQTYSDIAMDEDSTQAVLEEMLSLDISRRHRHHSTGDRLKSTGFPSRDSDSIRSSHSSGSGANGGLSPTNKRYSSGSSSSTHYSHTRHRHSGISEIQSVGEISSVSDIGEISTRQSTDQLVNDSIISPVSEASRTVDSEKESSSSKGGNSLDANSTDPSVGDSTPPGSARRLLVYTYTQKTESSTSTSSSSMKETASSSSSTSNSTSTSHSLRESTPAVDTLREPAAKRSHVLAPLTYSFWSTRSSGGAHISQSQVGGNVGDELDHWIAQEVESRKKETEKMPTTMR